MSTRRDRQESLFELNERELFRNRDKVTPDVTVKSMDEIVNSNDFNFLKDVKMSLLSKPRHVMEKFRRGDIPFYGEDDPKLTDTQLKLTGESPGTNSIAGAEPVGGEYVESKKDGSDVNKAVELSEQINFPRPINSKSKRRKTSRTNDVQLLQEAISNYRRRQNVFNVVPSGHLRGGYGGGVGLSETLGQDFRNI